jgi:hypothetical protein
MKKITILLFALAFSILAFSQANSLPEGNNCFTKGDYACAIEKYKEAMKLPDKRQLKIAADNLRQAEKCLELINIANAAFNSNNYSEAKEHYQNVLNENSKDQYARKRLKEVQNKLFTLALPKVNISGNLNINYGESTTLKIEGGSLNGKAVWRWYLNECGGSIVATGESVKIAPLENEQYFVRAENSTDTSLCLTVSVKVDPNSKEPERIEGKKSFCPNEKNIPLTVKGGKLGKGARWSWHQDSLKGKNLGYGQVIYVSPVKRTTYYLVIEGGPNSISPISFEMNSADEKFTDPEKILGSNFICNGSPLQLEVSGGKISQDSSWTWYKNNLNKTSEVGKGRKIVIYPNADANYIVRGEGNCTFTNTKSIAIEVSQSSAPPFSIQVANDPNNKRQVTLSLYGGSLGRNANWVWLKDDCNSKNPAGTGESISVKPRKVTSYYVKAIGECNSTSCVSATINPRLVDKYFFINFGTIIPSGENDITSAFEKFGKGSIYSLTIGKVAKTGWYVRAKFNGQTNTKEYTIENSEVNGPPGSYFVYNNEIANNRLSATFGITKRLARTAFLLVGAGYGQRELLWGIYEYSNSNNSYLKSGWGNNKGGYYAGPEAEAGLLLKVSIFNISLGINAIVYNTQSSSSFNQKPYFDYQMGIGINF